MPFQTPKTLCVKGKMAKKRTFGPSEASKWPFQTPKTPRFKGKPAENESQKSTKRAKSSLRSKPRKPTPKPSTLNFVVAASKPPKKKKPGRKRGSKWSFQTPKTLHLKGKIRGPKRGLKMALKMAKKKTWAQARPQNGLFQCSKHYVSPQNHRP